MADDIIQRIKNIAHEVSENYLLFGSSMNESISQKFDKGEIDNTEMLKRICEHANQNVYLSKFQDKDARGNIIFDLADFGEIKKNIDESEKSMELYDRPPEDFRSSLEIAVDKIVEDRAGEEKTAGMDKEAAHVLSEYKQVFVKLASAAESLKTESMGEVESSLNLMFGDAKRMVANGEYLGDIAKIASRCAQEDNINPYPVAKAYGIIEKELSNSGFDVNTEFTKVSSLKINHASAVLRPVKAMAMAIEKVSAFEEMTAKARSIVEIISEFERKRDNAK